VFLPLEAVLVYPLAENLVRVVPEPQERLAPQQSREAEIFVFERFSNWVYCHQPGGLREVVPGFCRVERPCLRRPSIPPFQLGNFSNSTAGKSLIERVPFPVRQLVRVLVRSSFKRNVPVFPGGIAHRTVFHKCFIDLDDSYSAEEYLCA
jgi:hypothetical protein